jgi:uncharacterized protein involved in response to NO
MRPTMSRPVIPLVPSGPKATPEGARKPPGPWRWSRLLSAPHRLGFMAGALGMALTALWWLAALHLTLPWSLPSTVVHGLVFSAGFMPFFFVGFLFTAGPRWLGMGEVAAPTLLRPVLLLALGWLLLLAGAHAERLLAAAGLLLAAAGWGWITARFAALERASPVPDRSHARFIVGAATLGTLALLGAAAALAADQLQWLRLTTQLMLWGWIAPTFVIVSHRMLPFFSAAVLPGLQAQHKDMPLAALLALLALAGVTEGSAWLGWPLPTPLRWVAALVLAAGAAQLLRLALQWGLARSLGSPGLRLLAMLHGGFVWFGLTLALVALSQGLQAAGWPGLGAAPLHALTLGYLGCTLVAMATRVAAGHSGRPLAVDRLAWALYLLLQAAVLLRLAAAQGWIGLSLPALAWALVALSWAWRHGAWLGRPRIDGRPG